MEDKKESCWSPITNRLRSIEDYYGIELGDMEVSKITNEIINILINKARNHMPNKFYANCVNGEVKYGKILYDNIVEIIALRYRCKQPNMNTNMYERMLLKTEAKFTYCYENETLYSNVNPLIGRYIMRHKLSENIVKLVTCTAHLADLKNGNLVTLFDKYIKNEKNINIKKDILKDSLPEMFSPSEIRSNYFPLFYYDRMLHKQDMESGKYEQRVFTDDLVNTTLVQLCIDYDIPFWDAVKRVNLGCSIERAVTQGIRDKEKFGFVYDKNDSTLKYDTGSSTISMRANNYNFVKYMEYLAKHEEKELGIEVG